MRLKVAKGQNCEPYVGHTHFAESMRGAEETELDELGKPGGIQCSVFRKF